jgi:hypothetical protein
MDIFNIKPFSDFTYTRFGTGNIQLEFQFTMDRFFPGNNHG